ncbi:MAG: hypothetical protein K0Q51_6 [Rickettsiaceae bacterium]|nr:hypothetical protein [Rickettsiaceae bacterium]
MAGMGGFEPPNDGTKNRCLTTWRHPKICVMNLTKHLFVKTLKLYNSKCKSCQLL